MLYPIMDFERFTIPKLDAARRQLFAAIGMHFDRQDPLAVHTVSSAANEILRQLAARLDIPALIQDHPWLRPERREEFRRILRTPANFLKHADKDPDGSLEFFPTGTHLQMFESADLLMRMSGTIPPECGLFVTWCWLRYPDLVNPQLIQAMPQLGQHLSGLDWRDFDAFQELFRRVHSPSSADTPSV
jgi:hypothetical protein